MKIAIASDHRGFNLKEELKKHLSNKYEIIDLGTDSTKSVDYPKYAFSLCEKVINNSVDLGIAICGTGIGMSIACNKVKGIRCAKISNLKEAKYAKEHNHANVLALCEDINISDAVGMIEEFIKTEKNMEEKYINRNNYISLYENNNEC